MESGRTKKQIISRRRLRLSVFNTDDASGKRKNEKYLVFCYVQVIGNVKAFSVLVILQIQTYIHICIHM